MGTSQNTKATSPLLALEDEEKANAAPPLPDTPVSRLGDLWLLGSHRVLCGSATSAEAVAWLLGERKPRLMVTDPPYGDEEVVRDLIDASAPIGIVDEVGCTALANAAGSGNCEQLTCLFNVARASRIRRCSWMQRDQVPLLWFAPSFKPARMRRRTYLGSRFFFSAVSFRGRTGDDVPRRRRSSLGAGGCGPERPGPELEHPSARRPR